MTVFQFQVATIASSSIPTVHPSVMTSLVEFIAKRWGYHRFQHPAAGQWPLIMRGDGGKWFIFCSPSFLERHRRGALLVLIVVLIAFLKMWQASYERSLGIPFESLFFGSWPRTAATAAIVYFLAGLTFISRYFLVTPNRLRYAVVYSIRYQSTQELGILAQKDRTDEQIWHLTLQWGIDGAVQRHLTSFRGGKFSNNATSARVALQLALNNGQNGEA